MPVKPFPAKTLYVALAMLVALIGLFASYAYHLHYDLDVPLGQAIGQGIVGGVGVIATCVGVILYCFMGLILPIYYTWFHVIPVTVLFIVAATFSYKKLHAPWRSIAFWVILLLWLAYGGFCAARYISG